MYNMIRPGAALAMTDAMSSSGSTGKRCWWMTETWVGPDDVRVAFDGSLMT
jgi:hypothetical protein